MHSVALGSNPLAFARFSHPRSLYSFKWLAHIAVLEAQLVEGSLPTRENPVINKLL